ncbi:MAG: hypothetical protein H6525_06615 [Actinobacteria bacterium]|nr:hypothetical protein [Actinomycetota bacterium]MCB9412502.1 hypothetical protein [Actinomycetota bacterium]
MGESNSSRRSMRHRASELVTPSGLRSQGMDSSEIRSVLRSLHRVRRGVYVESIDRDPHEHHLTRLRALQMIRGNVAASHASAAVAHGLWVPPEYLNEVHLTALVGGAKGERRGEVHLHAGPLPDGAVSIVDDVVTTTLARTVLDCATCLPFVDAVVVADQALRRPDVTAIDLASAMREAGRRRGIAQARRVLRLADEGAESPGETRVRLILAEAGYDVESQVEVRDRSGRFVGRVDLMLRSHSVFVEFDGRSKYQLGDSVESVLWREKQRFDALVELGLEGVRVVWNQLADPGRIAQRIAAAIARVHKRGLGHGHYLTSSRRPG